jgi:hypothetical protein
MTNTTTLVRTLEKSIATGSLRDLIRTKDVENVFLLLDCSGSMEWPMGNGQTRITGLRKVVDGVQQQRPTRMIAFGPTFGVAPGETSPHAMECAFVEQVPDPAGGTPLTEAINFAKRTGAGRLLLISDGAPNNRETAMGAAREFGGRIDVVFVGEAGDPGSAFLESLAKETGGGQFEGDLGAVKELTGNIVALLTGATLEEDDDEEDDEDDENGDTE